MNTHTDAHLQEFRALAAARDRGEPIDLDRAVQHFKHDLYWLTQVGCDVHPSGVAVTPEGRKHLKR